MDMPSVNLPEASLTWNNLLLVLACIVCLAGVLVALVKGWEAYKKISIRDRVKTLEDDMKGVKSRLDLGTSRFRSQSDDMGQILISMHAIVMHMISGNDKDKLQATEKELTAYMARRTTREQREENEMDGRQ